MAMSNAERQAAYRARHLKDGARDHLSVVIDSHAKQALERLASFYGIPQREALEHAIAQAERAALVEADKLPNGAEDYAEKRLRFQPKERAE